MRRWRDGQIRVRNDFLSVEPAMRGWIADKGNYSAPVEIGSVMRALAVGEVVESRAADFAPGEIVTGWFGWQDYADVAPAAVVRRVGETDLPRSLALGVLGINGVTALIGLEADRRAEGRRDRAGLDGGGGGRLRGRADRQDPADAGRSASPAARTRSRCAATSSAMTPRSTIGRRL